jgi:hypothetical protein
MNHINRLVYLLLAIFCWSCTHNSETEKHQGKRDNVIHVQKNIKAIQIDSVLIGSWAILYSIGDYLIISDYKSIDKQIHLFDKNSFKYVLSFADRGQGPGEITRIGHVGVDEANRKLYISDHGKQKIFSYDLDSLLADPSYMPTVKMQMNVKKFPDRYQYINDTLSVGLIIEPDGNGNFKQSVGKWNMQTGKIELMKYEHPDIHKKRIAFTASMKHGIYVECYFHYDLMTICSLDGELKYNIYGRQWHRGETNKVDYYDKVAFCGDRIFALYSGENAYSFTGIREVANQPTKFLVFDITGDYIHTLETGYPINHFHYDLVNNRIIMNLDDEIQFAYLDLDGIIE